MVDAVMREELISKLSTNLPLLRAKMRISQSELADAVGIGRQTFIAIENATGKMRWDTCLALMLIISMDPDAAELMNLLDLNFSEVSTVIEKNVLGRKSPSAALQDKIWTDSNCNGEAVIRGIVPLPVGYVNSKCPKCNSTNIRGALVSPSADEQDPNIICLECGYWWD